MAVITNERDILLQATSPRAFPYTFGTLGNYTGDSTGTLDGTPVATVVSAALAPNGDVTETILENSGTVITVNSSTLFQSLGTGLAGVFIGSGGLFGKNSAGTTTFSIDASNGNATFAGTLSAATGTFSGSLSAASGTFNGTITATATVDSGTLIAGTAASTINTNASNGATAYSDTFNFRVPGAPTNLPVIGAITTSASAVGTVDIKLTWTYTQGAIAADHFIIYYLEGTTNPTISSPVLATLDGGSRDLSISGVPMDKSYKFGIVAGRQNASGVEKTAIVNAWTRTSATANITANIDGTAPAGVKNTAITLSSSGSLLGAGGGSITALDYANVSGTKPPATATSNFFTTSTVDPTGGADGDAHWNSTSSTMWFKISGVWRKGGTINASQITVGTLAAAQIAASSITSDKLSVSTLSAIAANLGTVNAGNISGSANISITGTGSFNGATDSGGVNYAGVFNSSLGTPGGVSAFAGTSGFAVRGSAGTTGSIGVSGTANSAGGEGVRATNSAGTALNVVGTMVISSTTLVTNLNAQKWNGATNNGISGSGSSVATFINNTKPGSASNNSWLSITFSDGITRYIPAWQ